MADPLDCALDLLRRLPPTKTKLNLNKLCSLRPDLQDDLLSSVDHQLQVAKCSATGKDFLLCDYNRDGESYRSPWSGEFQPKTDGVKPSPQLAQLEKQANDAFETYRELYDPCSYLRYFGGGVSSVYLWDLDEGFAGVSILKVHRIINNTLGSQSGSWDSIHVIEVNPTKKSATYKTTSSIILQVVTPTSSTPKVDLAGSLTRQAEMEFPLDDYTSHVHNIGRLVEEMENKMRSSIEQVYFGKTKDILNDLRSLNDLKVVKNQAGITAQLLGKLNERGQKS
ncbi:F-actin-capping protein subunit beta [Globomyces sp. JEL0801]|nr:F-actin-capping protein subunit beta [Globomyces sp. JEL0801]